MHCDYCGRDVSPYDLTKCPLCGKSFCHQCFPLHKCDKKDHSSIKLTFPTSNRPNESPGIEPSQRITLLEKALCMNEDEIAELETRITELENALREKEREINRLKNRWRFLHR